MHKKTELQEVLKLKIINKRKEWREIRAIKLNIKEELFTKGLKITEIRKNKKYKEKRKEQKRISKEIKHLEKKLNLRPIAGR